MQIGALSVYPYGTGVPSWPTGNEGVTGARRGPQPRPVRPDESARPAGSETQTDTGSGFADAQSRGAAAAAAEASWYQRRHGPAALLAAMIENMGGAATSNYKGRYVDLRV